MKISYLVLLFPHIYLIFRWFKKHLRFVWIFRSLSFLQDIKVAPRTVCRAESQIEGRTHSTSHEGIPFQIVLPSVYSRNVTWYFHELIANSTCLHESVDKAGWLVTLQLSYLLMVNVFSLLSTRAIFKLLCCYHGHFLHLVTTFSHKTSSVLQCLCVRR